MSGDPGLPLNDVLDINTYMDDLQIYIASFLSVLVHGARQNSSSRHWKGWLHKEGDGEGKDLKLVGAVIKKRGN